MRLQFDPMADDDDRFFRVQGQLVDELGVWAADRFGDAEGLRAAWTGTFLQWEYQ